jgi:hypothetical protein
MRYNPRGVKLASPKNHGSNVFGKIKAANEEIMNPITKRKICSWLVTICCLCLFSLPSFAADIRGKITNVSPAGSQNPGNILGSVRIEGAKQRDTSVDKAMTRVVSRTKLFKMQEGKKVEATFEDFKVGQTVEATFDGPVAESYPVQGTAGEIVILD